MENESNEGEWEPANKKKSWLLPICIVASAIVIAAALVYVKNGKVIGNQSGVPPIETPVTLAALQEKVIPANGVTLPVRWGDKGKQMVSAGVIDEQKFEALYAQRGGLPSDMKALLDNVDNGDLVITSQNSGILLNLLWGLGLGNTNPILTEGPMEDPQYGGAKNFASTGGWTLSVGNAMGHYSAHPFVTLSADQQALVERVAKNIYRPCCGNSTYFPDCNHGMAMLGLLELMASQGVSEADMYKAALVVNSYWFPDTYLTIARYFESQRVDWSAVDPKTVLGSAYSSAQGYQQIENKIAPVQTNSSGGCGVQ
jgi:hypothetical protein